MLWVEIFYYPNTADLYFVWSYNMGEIKDNYQIMVSDVK